MGVLWVPGVLDVLGVSGMLKVLRFAEVLEVWDLLRILGVRETRTEYHFYTAVYLHVYLILITSVPITRHDNKIFQHF